MGEKHAWLTVTLRPARVYVKGHRIHHFWLGLLICLSDVRDWRDWVYELVRGDRA